MTLMNLANVKTTSTAQKLPKVGPWLAKCICYTVVACLLAFGSTAWSQSRPQVNVMARAPSGLGEFAGMLVYSNPASWLAADRILAADRQRLNDGKAVFSASLPRSGEYAFIFYIDQDNDRHFDRNFFGPTEPFALVGGISSGRFSRPTFTNALVTISNGVNQLEVQFDQ